MKIFSESTRPSIRARFKIGIELILLNLLSEEENLLEVLNGKNLLKLRQEYGIHDRTIVVDLRAAQ